MTALLIALAILAVPNVVLAGVLYWMHAATDARLTLRGFRYVSFVLAVAVCFVGLAVWGVASWVEVAGPM